jgi:hypothetical protein
MPRPTKKATQKKNNLAYARSCRAQEAEISTSRSCAELEADLNSIDSAKSPPSKSVSQPGAPFDDASPAAGPPETACNGCADEQPCDGGHHGFHFTELSFQDFCEPRAYENDEGCDWEDEVEELNDLTGEALLEGLRLQAESEMRRLGVEEVLHPDAELFAKDRDAFDLLAQGLTDKAWKQIEAQRGLGYNGHSERSKRRARENERKAKAEKEKPLG